MSALYSIGQLSRLTDCKVPTIRYYEQIGLLAAAARSEGNQRRYSESHLQQLRFIRHARSLGFEVADIRQLLHLSQCQQHDAHEAGRIAQHHLRTIKARIAHLNALKNALEDMVTGCCDSGAAACRVLSVLADHGLGQPLHSTDATARR